MKKIISVVGIIVALMAGCAVNTGIKYDSMFKNVVEVTTDHEYCSGWVLKGEKEVVTAAHCAPDDITAPLNVNFKDGKKHTFHIKKIGDEAMVTGPDLMVLYTNDTTIDWPTGFAPCTFKPFYGENLALLGGPLGFGYSVTTGKVSKPAVDLTDLMTMVDVPNFAKDLIEYDGALWPGNSGGPAVDVANDCVMGSGELTRNASPDAGFPDGVHFLEPLSELGNLK